MPDIDPWPSSVSIYPGEHVLTAHTWKDRQKERGRASQCHQELTTPGEPLREDWQCQLLTKVLAKGTGRQAGTAGEPGKGNNHNRQLFGSV